MRYVIERFVRLVKYSLVSSVLSSSAVLLCIWGVQNEQTIAEIIIPIIFWAGLIFEQYFLWDANRLLKKIEKNNKIKKIRNLPGIISIAKTRLGLIADCVLISALIGFVILFIGNLGEHFTQYILLFFIVLSFRIHCIANGKNYRYKNYLLHERGKRHDEKSKEKRN